MMNPVYLNTEKTLVSIEDSENCTVIVEPTSNPLLWDNIVEGLYGPVADYTPNDADGPDTPDAVVSRLQAKLALHQMGLLDQAEALVDVMDRSTKIAWAEATRFRRSSPLLNALAMGLTWPDGQPITDGDLDDLFQLAATIEV